MAACMFVDIPSFDLWWGTILLHLH